MSDDADRADQHIEEILADALAEVRRKPSLIQTGCCYYCSEPVPAHHLYCSSDCATDHQHLMERNKANGK